MGLNRYDQSSITGINVIKDRGRGGIQEKQHVQRPRGREEFGLLRERTEIRPVGLGHVRQGETESK